MKYGMKEDMRDFRNVIHPNRDKFRDKHEKKENDEWYRMEMHRLENDIRKQNSHQDHHSAASIASKQQGHFSFNPSAVSN